MTVDLRFTHLSAALAACAALAAAPHAHASDAPPGSPPITITLFGSDAHPCVPFVDAGGDGWMIVSLAEGQEVPQVEVGESFVVSGVFCTDCIFPFCGSFEGFIFDAQISDAFSGCGTLTLLEDPSVCTFPAVAFVADEGGTYSLENHGDFQAGDRVFVEGIVDPFCPAIPECPLPCIFDNTIEACANDTFEGCGTFGIGPQGCLLFHADSGETFGVESGAPKDIGSHVFVSGTINPDSFACFPFDVPGIQIEVVSPCQVPEPFGGCGTIAFSVFGCIVLDVDNDGGEYILENLGEFTIGDHVHVTGIIDTGCISTCFLPCISDNTIELCDGGGEPFEGCGTLGPGPQGCLLFTPDGSLQSYAVIGEVQIPLTHVFISGTIVPDTNQCFPVILPGIEIDMIGECFEACGELVFGIECVLFEADTGETLSLENLGGFTVGDRVRVTGLVNEGCFTFCGAPCLENNTIESCVFADLNNDAQVNAADLALLLGHWGQCPICIIGPCLCTGDLNDDGFVNAADLALLLGAWTG